MKLEGLFLVILNMSVMASFVMIAVMLARLFLKKAPKAVSYALWAAVAFRLLIPQSIESAWSLMPSKPFPIAMDIGMQKNPRIDTGIGILDGSVALPPAGYPYISVNPLQIWIFVGSIFGRAGVCVMLAYSAISMLALKRRLRGATLGEDGIYELAGLETPFVIGVFKPRIYFPSGLSEKERSFMLLHERAHLRRGDHLAKMGAFLLLGLHWFNPLAWLSFRLMVSDQEMSCDEKVLNELGSGIKKEYSMALACVASGGMRLRGGALAFGEGGMKARVKNVLNFKKPSRVVIAVASIAAVILAVGFSLDRARGETMDDIIASKPHFFGVVEEAGPSSLLVRVNEGDEARRSSDLISVSLARVKNKEYLAECFPGDEIGVYFDGIIAESYPAQVFNVFAVTVAKRASESQERLEDRLGGKVALPIFEESD